MTLLNNKKSFQEIKEVSEKYNHSKAILAEIKEVVEEDDLIEDSLFVSLVATIYIPNQTYNVSFLVESISSGGLSGVAVEYPNFKEDEAFKNVIEDQLSELKYNLNVLNVATDLFLELN